MQRPRVDLYNFIYRAITRVNQDYPKHIQNFLRSKEEKRLDNLIENRFSLMKDVYFNESSSQLGQDILALLLNGESSKGYFVEFGATDGKTLSNTYLLESKFEWKGLLAEPARKWRQNLVKNRTCNIDFRCVWRTSNKWLNFSEQGELSGLSSHLRKNKSIDNYQVETISLDDLLDEYDAPSVINFLSIDTEGTELEILNNFNFDKRKIILIACEHNYSSKRRKIKRLLETNNFIRILVGESMWDDWYLHRSFAEPLE